MHDPLPSPFSFLYPLFTQPTLEFTKTQHEDHTTFASFLLDLNFYITVRQPLLSLILHPLLFAIANHTIHRNFNRRNRRKDQESPTQTRTHLCRVTAESYTHYIHV